MHNCSFIKKLWPLIFCFCAEGLGLFTSISSDPPLMGTIEFNDIWKTFEIICVHNIRMIYITRNLPYTTVTVLPDTYTRNSRRLELANVMILLINALTVGDVNVTLKYVKSVLWDGSDAAYSEVFGSEAVRQVISSYVPADRIYFVRSDSYRDKCFEVSALRQFIISSNYINNSPMVIMTYTWLG